MTDPTLPANWRSKLAAILANKTTEKVLIGLILINAIILGLETYDSVTSNYGLILTALDSTILAIFVVEIALRITAHGWQFFKDPWGIFDFTVVGIALIPASGALAVLRSLRILRALRILTLVPSMRRVVGGLLGAIPGLGSVIMVMGLIFYIGSVIATKLFGERFPDWFGTLGESAYTLFQIMTLESWSMGIARPVIEAFPKAWVFFVVFILIATFTMLNLFIAVIVNAIQAEHDREMLEAEQETAQHVDDQHEVTRREIASLRGEIRQLHELLLAAGKPANKP
ncbi:MAG: ion transporter [Burkholderiaceae bacterium]